MENTNKTVGKTTTESVGKENTIIKLEKEMTKLMPKLIKLRAQEDKQKDKVSQAERKLREMHEKTWLVSERVASITGRISRYDEEPDDSVNTMPEPNSQEGRYS